MKNKKGKDNISLGNAGYSEQLENEEDENIEPLMKEFLQMKIKIMNQKLNDLMMNKRKNILLNMIKNSKDKTISKFNKSFLQSKANYEALNEIQKRKIPISHNSTNITRVMRNKDNNQSNNEKTQNKRYAICPFCSDFANFTIDFNNPEQLWLKCNGCQNNKKISIIDYFNKINNKEVPYTKQLFCQEKKHKENLSYCIECKKNCCPICQADCKKKHSNQTIINTIKQELVLKKKSLIDNINNIVNIYVNKLKNLIKALGDSFEKLKERNENLFNFLQLNLDTFEKYPQQIIYDNYVNNSTWNEEQFIEDEDQLSEFNIANLLDYLNTFVFVKSNFDFSKFNVKNTVKKHRDYISCLLQLTSKRIASSSFDGTINIYNKDLQLEYSINAHTDNASSMLELRNNMLHAPSTKQLTV